MEVGEKENINSLMANIWANIKIFMKFSVRILG